MKVLIVCNNLLKGNGVRTAILSLRSRLMAEGVEVRLLSCENMDKADVQPEYPLPRFVFPFFEPLIYANGFRYAKIDKPMIRNAVEWADVVHVMEGFPLEAAVVKIAKEKNKPCVGTYHIFTENITSNLELRENVWINRWINTWWRKSTYDYCRFIQCPTQTVHDYLKGHGYTAELRVISNGIDISEPVPIEDGVESKPYRILTVGRLANEKSQMTLIRSLRYSRHAHEIKLQIAGKGPKAKKIKKAAQRLVRDGILCHEPEFGYYAPDELKLLMRSAYLYVHCATVEVEGLSCLEAIQQGAVPVIAKGRLSATHQFALDERSLFPVMDARQLAQRIDWWIEHPEARREMSRRYADSARQYDIRKSTQQVIQLYREAIQDERD